MRIAFLGDVYLNDASSIGDTREAIAGNTENSDIFGPLRRKIGSDALLVANVEFAITDNVDGRRVHPYKYAVLCSKSATALRLKSLHVGVLANNHAGDAGVVGLADTVANLRRVGVKSVGFGQTLEEAMEPCVLESDGNRIALVALCCLTTNGENFATHASPGSPPISAQTLRQAIEGARKAAQNVIVALHWGCEETHYPVPDQIRLGRMAIDAGASAVVGCHAHVIQTYERYKGCWIFHGLGNFFFDDGCAKRFVDGKFIADVPFEHAVKNRESLVPIFELRGGRLELADLFLTSWKGTEPPVVMNLSMASVNLEKLNAHLQRWVTQHTRQISHSFEPEFLCRVRNGVVTFSYCSQPIGKSWCIRDLSARLYRKALRIIPGTSLGRIWC